MYQYSAADQALVDARVAQFRDQTRRYLAGTIGEDEYKPLRLQNGLYIERHAPMLRIAIPYGVLSSRQLRTLADIADTYDRGFAHLTTRQNIQFNWVKLERVPDILADLAQVQMHAIQTSGSCIRNVTTDHFAGVAADEIVDPRPFAELMRQWSTLHPEFAFLPRKFKVAFNGAATDRAATAVHDLAFDLSRDSAGEVVLAVKVGGGQGRTPRLASVIATDLPWRHLMTYSEAVLRTYNRFGRRDNIYKARIKILVDALGAEGFAAEVAQDFAALQDGPGTLSPHDLAAVAAHFTAPAFAPPRPAAAPPASARYRRFVAQNLTPHRQPGYVAVTLSLKRPGVAPGDLTSAQMRTAAALADQFSFGELRVSHHQNLILPHVAEADLPALWQALEAAELAEPNIGLASDIICCPGGDYCALANAKSIPLAQEIAAHLAPREDEIGPLAIKISGCINACGHHHVGHIGVLGVEKGTEEFYQLLIGGRGEDGGTLAKLVGKAVPRAEVPPLIGRMVDHYLAVRLPGERFVDAVARLGPDPFKAVALASEGAPA